MLSASFLAVCALLASRADGRRIKYFGEDDIKESLTNQGSEISAERLLLSSQAEGAQATRRDGYKTAKEENAWLQESWDKELIVDTYTLDNVIESAKKWCHAKDLPAENRGPKKLQGLYWLNGLPYADPLACFSNGMWYKEKKMLRLWVWSSFLWYNTSSGRAGWARERGYGAHYEIKFKDEALTQASIHQAGLGAVGSVRQFAFDKALKLPFIEIKKPGLIWNRPNYVGIGPLRYDAGTYEAWKVLDGDLKGVKKHAKQLKEHLRKEPRCANGIVRYYHNLKGKDVRDPKNETSENTEEKTKEKDKDKESKDKDKDMSKDKIDKEKDKEKDKDKNDKDSKVKEGQDTAAAEKKKPKNSGAMSVLKALTKSRRKKRRKRRAR